jgi:hypothetical protein
MRQARYLIFRIEDGRLQDFGLYDTYEAAKKRKASAGLLDDWKIATIDYWPESVPAKRRRRGEVV